MIHLCVIKYSEKYHFKDLTIQNKTLRISFRVSLLSNAIFTVPTDVSPLKFLHLDIIYKSPCGKNCLAFAALNCDYSCQTSN